MPWGLANTVHDDSSVSYPADDLSRYRYHTGAPLHPIHPDEQCPLLFRDIGPEAMQRFLAGQLKRLAGPFSPVTYLRSWEYREPYIDYEAIGRLVFLQPLTLHPWHAGVPFVFVADARRVGDTSAIGFVPGHVSLQTAASRLENVRNIQELREAFGGREFDEIVAETHARLETLNAAARASERQAEPLRRMLQSRNPSARDRARAEMRRLDISESDLCAAWHHVAPERREHLVAALSHWNLPDESRDS